MGVKLVADDKGGVLYIDKQAVQIEFSVLRFGLNNDGHVQASIHYGEACLTGLYYCFSLPFKVCVDPLKGQPGDGFVI